MIIIPLNIYSIASPQQVRNNSPEYFRVLSIQLSILLFSTCIYANPHLIIFVYKRHVQEKLDYNVIKHRNILSNKNQNTRIDKYNKKKMNPH